MDVIASVLKLLLDEEGRAHKDAAFVKTAGI
jgi:hypothetical protein